MLWLAHFAQNFIYHIWWHTNVFVSWSFDLEAVFRIRDKFSTDPDLRVRTADFWIQIRILLRILLFLSVTFKTPTKNVFF
jgi:hypothetical protein